RVGSWDLRGDSSSSRSRCPDHRTAHRHRTGRIPGSRRVSRCAYADNVAPVVLARMTQRVVLTPKSVTDSRPAKLSVALVPSNVMPLPALTVIVLADVDGFATTRTFSTFACGAGNV